MEISEKDIEKLKKYFTKRKRSIRNSLNLPSNANLTKFLTSQLLEIRELEKIFEKGEKTNGKI